MAKKKVVKKGKKSHKNKPTSKKYTKYKIEGDKITREKTCPRCGPGVFLMQAKDRVYCGKCHYSEFQGKKFEESKEEKKE
jgi:ubiquitin-small subunit ribosomal protein S27Ae